MDIPDLNDAAVEGKKSEVTFEQQVNEATSKMEQNDKGVWEFPKDLDLEESVKVAATSEKRRRDAQSALSKEQHKNQILTGQIDVLKDRVVKQVPLELTVEQKEELEDLKTTDPETWRKKLDEYETEARTKAETEIDELGLSEEQATNLSARMDILEQFQKDNPELTINDDVIENELPPRLVEKLEKGKIDFADFLEEAKKYLTAGKVIKKDNDVVEPDLSKAGGGTDIDPEIKEDIQTSYNKEVY